MIIGIPKETHPGEQRVSLIPSSVDRLVKKGAQVIVETGLGSTIGVSDDEYKKVLFPYIDRDLVTLIEWPMKHINEDDWIPIHVGAFNDALKRCLFSQRTLPTPAMKEITGACGQDPGDEVYPGVDRCHHTR